MRGHAAARGEHTARGRHATDVVGNCHGTNENDVIAAGASLLRLLGAEDDGADGSAGRCGGAARDALEVAAVGDARVEKLVERCRIDTSESGGAINAVLHHQVHRDLHRRGGAALATARLQHEQLAILDGKLQVEHVGIVIFESRRDLAEFLARVRQNTLERSRVAGFRINGDRGAHAGDDVFALRLRQPLTVELRGAGGGITGECHAGAGAIVEVAEDHRLHVGRGAEVVGHTVQLAVNARARRVPGAEHRLHGAFHLLYGVVGKRLTDLPPVERQEVVDDALQGAGGQQRVALDSARRHRIVEDFLERFELQSLHDIGEHLDETPVHIEGEALVAAPREGIHDGLVAAQVQDGIHHSRHADGRAGAHRHEQRALGVPELLATRFLEALQRTAYLGAHIGRYRVVCQVGVARRGRDGEAGRDVDAEASHLGEVGALAAEQLAIDAATIGSTVTKEIDLLERHISSESWLRWILCGASRG